MDKLSLIGNTSLEYSSCFSEKLNAQIYLKKEYENLTHSAKDRIVKYVLNKYKEQNTLKENGLIICPTSGNTGISLSAIAPLFNYKSLIIMPDNVSKERIKMIEDNGGNVFLTPNVKGMEGAIACANIILKATPNSIVFEQFDMRYCVDAHYYTTGKEIYNDLNDVDVVICGIGTGGTITGISKYLKEKKNVYIIGVEPSRSSTILKGEKGIHKIQGIGAGFIPKILDLNLIDEVISVSDDDAYKYTKELKEAGYFCGISSGAVLCAAQKVCKKFPHKKIVLIMHDSGDRYISTGVFS